MKRVKYKVDLICQHKRKLLTKQQLATRSSHSSHQTFVYAIREKKTDCPLTMTIVLQNPTKKVLRTSSSPDDICSHATKIKLDFDHNHPICGAHFLSFCPIKEETKESFFQLFDEGHSAATSFHTYDESRLLQTSFIGNTSQADLANRAINPSHQDVSRLYSDWRRSEMGPENGQLMFEKLQAEVDQYNTQLVV